MTIDFTTIIRSYEFEGMIALGKLPNPMSGETGLSIDHAQYVIDLLTVLKSKTVNNLNDEEKRALDFILSNLQLNFVAERERPTAQPETPTA